MFLVVNPAPQEALHHARTSPSGVRNSFGILEFFFLSFQLRKRPYTTPQGRPERRKELTKRQLLTPLKDVPERRKAAFRAGKELAK